MGRQDVRVVHQRPHPFHQSSDALLAGAILRQDAVHIGEKRIDRTVHEVSLRSYLRVAVETRCQDGTRSPSSVVMQLVSSIPTAHPNVNTDYRRGRPAVRIAASDL